MPESGVRKVNLKPEAQPLMHSQLLKGSVARTSFSPNLLDKKVCATCQ